MQFFLLIAGRAPALLIGLLLACFVAGVQTASASDVVRDKKGHDFPCDVTGYSDGAFYVDTGDETIRKARLANLDRVSFDPTPELQLDLMRLKTGHQISLKVLAYEHRRFVVETDNLRRKKVPVDSIAEIDFDSIQERPYTHRSFADVPMTPETVTIGYWNLEWFPGGMDDWTKDKVYTQTEEVASIINRYRPTVLFASEIRNLKALVRLNHQLDRPYPYIATTDYWTLNVDRSGNPRCKQEAAVLSDLPFTSIREIDVGRDPELRPINTKGLLRAMFNVHGNRLVAYACHFKSNFVREHDPDPQGTNLKNIEKREALAKQIVLDIKKTGLDPMTDHILVCGDFNTDAYVEKFKGEKTIPTLIRAGFINNLDSLTPRARVTIPAKEGDIYPDGTFDYMFTSRGLGPVDVRVIQEGAGKHVDILPGMPGHASDHYMIQLALPRR